jgi:hypothetical protein
VMRGNTVRRADQGLNEQSAGWGNLRHVLHAKALPA